MTIANKCKGCNSNKTIFKLPYYQCKSYLSSKDIYLHTLFKEHDLQKIFREEYCPCTQCLVKVTCKDPKMYIPFTSYTKYMNEKHKCELYYNQVIKYRIYVIEYMKQQNLKLSFNP